MNVLVVGGGGREHALAWKLARSPGVGKIYCAPGNGGTAALGQNLPIPLQDVDRLARVADEVDAGLTVIGPDDALAAGLVDRLQAAGRRALGPTQAAARLESSKQFGKEFLRRHGVPTAAAAVFERSADAHAYCRDRHAYPVVIKADGLATGKGVIVAAHPQAAAQAIHDFMERGRFGAAGRRVLIEDYLEGTECSLHLLLDGAGRYRLLPLAQDYKRAADGDQGPNTGGMGAVSPPARGVDPAAEARIEREVVAPLVAGLAVEGIGFRGLLFPGLMLTADGPKVLELNVRFGDPETQVILPRLRVDLLALLVAAADGRLDQAPAELPVDPRPAVCVVLASAGYPEKVSGLGAPITGLADPAAAPEFAGSAGVSTQVPAEEEVHVFHAGTGHDGSGRLVTTSGRVLGVTALGSDLTAARTRAYAAADRIRFTGRQCRQDIGA